MAGTFLSFLSRCFLSYVLHMCYGSPLFVLLPSAAAAEEEKSLQAQWQQGLLAPLPETNRGYSLQLDGHKKARKFLYTNGRHVVIRSLDARIS